MNFLIENLQMKKKIKKGPINNISEEKKQLKKYTIEELIELGYQKNKIEIASDMLNKKSPK